MQKYKSNKNSGDILIEKGAWKDNEHLPYMHYSPSKYEQHIVCKYGVVLIGFPKPVMCNPSDFGSSRQLNILVKSLKDGSCRWEHLSEEDWDKRKDALLREDGDCQRKERSDKGKKRKRTSESNSALRYTSASKRNRTATSTAMVNSDGEGEEIGGQRVQDSNSGDKENDISLA